jgi:HSP20 family protein
MSDFYWKEIPFSHSLANRKNLLDYQEQIFNKFYDEFFNNRKNFIQSNTTYPKMDITETEDTLYIDCSVPGVLEEDLDIETEKETRFVTIKGKSHIAHSEDTHIHLKELKLSAFSRTVKLPDYVNIEKCKANLMNGILTLQFEKIKPKEKVIEPAVKKISINKD